MFQLFKRKTPVLPMHHNYKEGVIGQNEFPSGNAVHPWNPDFQDAVIVHNPLYVGPEQRPKVNVPKSRLEIVVDAFERDGSK